MGTTVPYKWTVLAAGPIFLLATYNSQLALPATQPDHHDPAGPAALRPGLPLPGLRADVGISYGLPHWTDCPATKMVLVAISGLRTWPGLGADTPKLPAKPRDVEFP